MKKSYIESAYDAEHEMREREDERKDNMKKRRFSREPQGISDRDWYYEQADGILLVHEITRGGHYFRTDQILIPNRLLARSFKRMFPGREEVQTCLKKSGQ